VGPHASDPLFPGCACHTFSRESARLRPIYVLQKHIQKHFVPFCKDAIQSFLAVGFVPFRIRRHAGEAWVPEVLPLGTYTWSVNMTESAKKRKRTAAADDKEEDDDSEGAPLLFYDVLCTYCRDKIHVFNYMQPHATLNCYSPLASLIPQYNTLLSLRENALQAVHWNATPKMALEEQEKVMINGLADSGSCITQITHNNPIAQVWL